MQPTMVQQEAQSVQQTDYYHRLTQRIETAQARIGILGMGYVGLPLALEFGEAGFRVTGFDVNAARVSGLRQGVSHVTDISDQRVAQAIDNGMLVPTSDFEALADQDAVVICVPTPLRKSRDPDLTYVMAATDEVAEFLRPGQLIVLESTTYPGTTDEIVLPRLEARGLEVGNHFFLAFSPERVDPGNKQFGTRETPKIVGGVTARCRELGLAFYRQIVLDAVGVTSTRVAEMVKLLENTFRAVNIALVNEMAQMCTYMDIDVWEVINAAATKPFGFMPFFPGPGLGGHCIPIDPIYLQWKATIDGFAPELIHLADKINRGMPRYVVARVGETLNEHGQAINGARIHVLGVAYKRDVSDARESPALEIIGLLRERGAIVSYSDPYIPSIELKDASLAAEELSEEVLHRCDLALVTTDHTAFDYEKVAAHAPLVFDTRNASHGIVSPNVKRL